MSLWFYHLYLGVSVVKEIKIYFVSRKKKDDATLQQDVVPFELFLEFINMLLEQSL